MTRDISAALAGSPVRHAARPVAAAHPHGSTPLEWTSVFASRLGVLAVAVLVWAGGIQARLIYLQVFKRSDLMAQAVRQQEDREKIPATRGAIVDRRGAVLAMSVRGYALEADLRLITDTDRAMDRACEALDRCTPSDRQTMSQLVRKPHRYVRLRHRISDDEARRVMALNDPAIRAVEVSHRYYPNGETAAHVLGYLTPGDVAQTGVEKSQDARIAGKSGLMIAQVTGGRERMRLTTRVLQPPTAGATIELTLDRDLQFIAERELKAAIAEHRAQGGTVVVMDPWNGDVLAMASAPTFNPNRWGDYSPEWRQNRAALHIYEPGSTFKIFLAAAAFEAARMDPQRVLDVSQGYVQLGSRRVYDVHRYGPLSFTDVVVKSSNVGAIKVGLELGPEVISRYVSRFGFGEALAMDVGYQRKGIVDPRMASFDKSALASVSMGYQIGVTPLQMAAAVSSIANGGELVAPRLVRATVSGDRRTEFPRRVVRRTVGREVAATVAGILEQVVERGTATAARIEGYSIAGKTGTAARLVDGRYSKSEYNASFVGFLPSRNPRVTILVVIDSPRSKGYYGGVVAAPVFKRVAEAALRHLSVLPDINPLPPVLVATAEPEGTPIALPVRSMMRPRATTLALPLIDGVMPDVRGLSAREAMGVLARLGIEPRVSGHGFVSRQGITPGTPLVPGSTCVLVLTRDPIPIAGPDGGAQP